MKTGNEYIVCYGDSPKNIKTGDKLEVYGEYYQTCGPFQYVSNVIAFKSDHVEFDYDYYIKKISSECISISVWTDKSEYNIGETVTIYYQTNTACTAKLTVTKPDGTQVVVGGPNEIPVCTRSKSAAAGYPTGTRTVTFEAWTDDESKKATCYFDVVEEEKPDLIIQDISWNPYSPQKGDTVTYTVKIKNQGSGDATAFYAYYYIDDDYHDMDTVYGLSAGSTTTQTFTWTVDKCGNVPIKAVADANNAVSESNEGNNERTETVSVECPDPDLIIQDISWSPSSPQQGNTITYTVTIKNQGSGLAGTSTVKYYVDGSYVTSDSVPSLSAGSTSTQTFTWTANKCENVQVKAVADANSDVSESNEGNNERTETVSITCNKPDLIIQDISWNPCNPTENDEVTFHYTIKNQGDADTTDFTTALYINGERYDISARGSFKAEESNDRFFTRTWTATCGDHAIKVVADDLGEIGESEEGNNERTETVSVECPDTDYIIQDISWSPNSPEQGDSITFTVTIKNQGVWDDSQFYVYYYIDGSYYDMDTIYGMGTGSTKTETFTWTADRCGNVHVKAVADANNVIPESNEGNNERTETVSTKCPTSKPDISITGGQTDYKPLQVFFKDSEVHVTVQNPDVYTYIAESWEDTNNNLELDGDEWWRGPKIEKTTSESEFNIQIPDDMPIGLYRVKIEGSDCASNNFYVIFNPMDSGLPQEEINNYWKDESTGDFHHEKIKTSHHKSELLMIMASSSHSYKEEYAVFDFASFVNTALNPKAGTDPPADIIELVNDIKNFKSGEGEKPDGDCDVFATLLVAIARSSGAPARLISGEGLGLPPWKHGWTEVFYDGNWQAWDATFVNPKFGTNYKQLISTCKKRHHDFVLWDVFDEKNVNRCADYGPCVWRPDSWISASITCPANLHAYDSQGRHVGVSATGGIDLGIPDAYYTGPDYEHEKIVIYDQNDDIIFKIEALDTGEFDFTLTQSTETKTTAVTYLDVPIIKTTEATVDVSQANPTYTMEIDNNGDGTTDKTKKPDSIETDAGQDKYSIQLNTGWNLISIPIIPDDTDILDVMNSLAGNWNSVWFYEAGNWKRYDLTGPDFLNDLTTIEPGKGYWIDMKSDDTLSVSGSEPTTKSISLSAGWNLVGYNSLNSKSTTSVMNSVTGNWNSVWSYEAGNWKRYDLTGPDFLNDLTILEPGKGYWIDMKSSDTWTLGGGLQ